MEMIVYKIVSVYAGGYHSLVISAPGFDTNYQINEWVYPKIGKIFAFKDLQSAKKYKCNDRDKIFLAKADRVIEYECEIANTTHNPVILKSFWDRTISSVDLTYAPEGTVLCDKIKIIKEV